MKTGKVVGGGLSLAGISVGLYYGISPILESLSHGVLSGQQAGIYFAIVSSVLGLFCAAMSMVVSSNMSKTQYSR